MEFSYDSLSSFVFLRCVFISSPLCTAATNCSQLTSMSCRSHLTNLHHRPFSLLSFSNSVLTLASPNHRTSATHVNLLLLTISSMFSSPYSFLISSAFPGSHPTSTQVPLYFILSTLAFLFIRSKSRNAFFVFSSSRSSSILRRIEEEREEEILLLCF